MKKKYITIEEKKEAHRREGEKYRLSHKDYNRIYHQTHKEEAKAWSKDYYRRNSGEFGKRAQANHLKQKYNITKEEYDRLFKEQDGGCAVCGKPESKKYRGKVTSLAVDHNHKTGEIRGLLCFACNISLGPMEENIDLLAKLITYLKGD